LNKLLHYRFFLGLNKDEFNKLKTKQFEKNELEENNSCVICLTEFNAKDTVIKTPCNHYYHKDCLWKWVKEKDTVCFFFFLIFFSVQYATYILKLIFRCTFHFFFFLSRSIFFIEITHNSFSGI
jgi:hypothetical protein